MREGNIFRAHTLGARSTLVLALSMAGSAYGQDAAQPSGPAQDDTETIVVTGIKKSLADSAQQKRNSDIILDSITSEDLGKFPDANVAESLQRIPGVSIDRTLGQGASVTVRGFGPQFNNVLLNGRALANDTDSRGFQFDNIPAELISGAAVYKSSRASIPEGGIGSTIDLKTPRPLDIGESKGILSLRGHYETLSEEVTPNAFGLWSDVFDDGRMGILLSASYQKRNAREDSFTVSGYVPNDTIGTQAGQTDGYGPNLDPNVPLFTDVRFPRNYNLNRSVHETERTGFTGTFQFQPSEDLTFTVDAISSRYDIDRQVQTGAFFFLENQVRTAEIDDNRDVVAQTENGQWDLVMQNYPRKSLEQMVAFNTDWKVSDKLHLVGDVSLSRAHNLGGRGSYYVVVGIPTNVNWSQPANGGMPTLEVLGASVTDPSNARAHYATAGGGNTVDDVDQAKLDATYDVGEGLFRTVRVGASVLRDRKSQRIYGVGSAYCTYCGYPIVVDQSLLRPLDLGSDFLGGLGGSAPLQFLQYDGGAYLDYLGSPAAANALDAHNGVAAGTTLAALAANGGYQILLQPSSYRVKDTDTAAYVETDFGGEFGSMPWFLNAGVRYIHTDVTADGQNRVLQDILWVSEGNQSPIYANDVPQAQSFDTSYRYFLPSANFRLNVTDELVVRLAASKTVTRPNPSDMRPNTTIDDTRPGNMLASGGNPALRPYISKNYDLSLEWYPKSSINLSAAYFHKDVTNFIDYGVAPEAFTIQNAQRLDQTSVINGNTHLADPNFTATTATFLTSRPRNLAKTYVYGVEVAGLYTFDFLPGWWSGFGVTANATIVHSDAKVSDSSHVTGRAFALPGLGNSYNVVGFYEKGPISARVAYNKRDEFLASLSGDGSGGPVFTQTYSQIDARAAYQFSEHMNVYVEGTNIGEKHLFNKGLYNNELIGNYLDGAFYNIGVRVDF
jgi:iron complex outermembrane receptor protein